MIKQAQKYILVAVLAIGMSVAKKPNLKFEEAEPKLIESLVKSISGLL